MNILFIGNYLHDYCTEVHLTRTLEQLGHSVLRVQESNTDPQDIEWQAKNWGADIVWYQRTWGFGARNAELTDVWRRLEKQYGIVTVSYHLDLYYGLERAATLAGDPFWTTQHVFTADGDPEATAWFASLGINHHWMPPAVVADECVPGVRSEEFFWPVVFVGSESYHHEWPNRKELLDFLSGEFGSVGYRRYGSGAEVVRSARLNDLYASASVVVGDSLCPVRDDGTRKPNYWSDRPYETVGRGGFLLMPRVPGLEEHFIDGEHLVFYDFGDYTELRRLIYHYLVNPDARDQIRTAGQAHVRAHHTYAHRLASALQIIGA